MKTFCQLSLGFIGALALAGTALGQVPSTNDTSDGTGNTGSGTNTLKNLTTATDGADVPGGAPMTSPPAYAVGVFNSAFGYEALYSDTTGPYNSASGYLALYSNTTGSDNTAAGAGALYFNSTGSYNTAAGANALNATTTGSDNTAAGYEALYSNTTGAYNTASGFEALFSNTKGTYNNASGYGALHYNSSGAQNNASGVNALYENTTGDYNTAAGTDALFYNTIGFSNIGVGYRAGYNLTTGSNNIDIGNPGVAAESGTIRIGGSSHTAAYIAGVYGTPVTGSAVVVSSTGQLGVTVSSERFKTAIAPMGSDTVKLGQLRPVSFKLKSDSTGTRQYGLIAEEVAKIYPELVIRDQSGRIDGVRYDELAPMLLNEVQKLTAQVEKNAAQAAEFRDLKQQVIEMRAAIVKLQANGQDVARR